MEITVTLTQEDLHVLFGALGEVPVKVGYGVTEKLQKAVEEFAKSKEKSE